MIYPELIFGEQDVKIVYTAPNGRVNTVLVDLNKPIKTNLGGDVDYIILTAPSGQKTWAPVSPRQLQSIFLSQQKLLTKTENPEQ